MVLQASAMQRGVPGSVVDGEVCSSVLASTVAATVAGEPWQLVAGVRVGVLGKVFINMRHVPGTVRVVDPGEVPVLDMVPKREPGDVALNASLACCSGVPVEAGASRRVSGGVPGGVQVGVTVLVHGRAPASHASPVAARSTPASPCGVTASGCCIISLTKPSSVPDLLG